MIGGKGQKTNRQMDYSVTGETVCPACPWLAARNSFKHRGRRRPADGGAAPAAPTMFVENRALLDTAPARRPYPADDLVLPFGQAAA